MVNRGKVKGHPADSPTATDPTQPKTDQRGTKDSPLVVNTEKSGETEYEAAEKKRRDDADAVKDIGEFWLTFAIAVATICTRLKDYGTEFNWIPIWEDETQLRRYVDP